MENTNTVGIIRHLDDLGRIVIPKEIRNQIGVEEGDSLNLLTLTDGSLLLRKMNDNKPMSDCSGAEKTEPKKKVIHFVDNYNEVTKVVTITTEQEKLLDWLIQEDYFGSDIEIHDNYPKTIDLT